MNNFLQAYIIADAFFDGMNRRNLRDEFNIPVNYNGLIGKADGIIDDPISAEIGPTRSVPRGESGNGDRLDG